MSPCRPRPPDEVHAVVPRGRLTAFRRPREHAHRPRFRQWSVRIVGKSRSVSNHGGRPPRSGSVRGAGYCVHGGLSWPRAPPSSGSTSSSWAPGSAARWRPTGWPRPAARSSCWSAAAPTRPAASRARRAAWRANFWEPGEGRHGLFDVWSFEGIDGVVSSGLGGGSLIYANVLLRKDEKWFVHEQPLPRRRLRALADLPRRPRPALRRVEAMIGAAPYPYTDTPKTDRAARRPPTGAGSAGAAAAARGQRSPAGPGEDAGAAGRDRDAGVRQHPRPAARPPAACSASATSAATTAPRTRLDHTYLSAAQHARRRHPHPSRGQGLPAARRDEGGGYEVTYVVHTGADGEPAVGPAPRTTITLRAAGAGGRHVRHDLPAAAQPHGVPRAERGARHPVLRQRRPAGVRDERVAATASAATSAPTPGRSSPAPSGSATTLDGDGVDAGRGHYIEDAGYPAFAAWLAETGKGLGHARRGRSSSATGRPSRT